MSLDEGIIIEGLKNRISEFLKKHHQEELEELAETELQENITIDYKQLAEFDQTIADDLANSPDQWITNAKAALRDYEDHLENTRVLVSNYEKYNPAIRNLRDKHFGKLTRLDGTVSKATSILPKADVAAFECQVCGTVTKVKQPLDSDLEYPRVCSGEDCDNRTERKFRVNPTLSNTINFRKIEIQEPPEETSGGQTPETQTFTVKGDIADNITAGDNVTAIGIYKASDQGNTSIFRTYIKGNNIIPEEKEFEELEISDEDIEQIKQLAQQDDIYEQLRDSIAPNLYDLTKEKEAILYQLFRGVRKTKMEGTTVRGDIHVLLCGDPGTGKSLKNTKIIQKTGNIKDISDFVEDLMDDPTEDDDGDLVQELSDDVEVLAMDEDAEIQSRQVEAIWKKKVDNALKIELKDGRRITSSDTHPLFTTDGNAHIEQIKAGDIHEGDYIAIPREIDLEDLDYVSIDDEVEDKHGHVVNVPNKFDEEFAEFLGLMIAEGSVSVSAGNVNITNSDDELIEIMERGFDRLVPHEKQYVDESGNTKQITYWNRDFAMFFESIDKNLGKASRGKRVPEQIFKSPESVREAFVRTYIDGEVHVDGQMRRELNAGSMSKDLLHDVQRLLDTLGISSRVKTRTNSSTDEGESYRLRITGKAFEKYTEEIGFVSERKQERAEKIMEEKGDPNTNVDVVPDVQDVIKETRQLLGMTQHDFSISRSTYHGYEYEGKQVPREQLQRLVKDMVGKLRVLRGFEEVEESELTWSLVDGYRKFASLDQSEVAEEMGYTGGTYRYHMDNNQDVRGHQMAVQAHKSIQEQIDEDLHEAHENLIRLESLAWGDIRWVPVESVEEVECDDEWMYDLQVEGTHNYIANGIMSHNSQLLRYASKLAPRGVMTSGQGASEAGLCVGPDTLINYDGKITKISDIVNQHISSPVESPAAVSVKSSAKSYDIDNNSIDEAETTHLWRMPKQEAKKIRTSSGRELVISDQTPVLVSTEDGLDWVEADNLESGQMLSVQDELIDSEDSKVGVNSFVEFDKELIDLKDSVRREIKDKLKSEFGTLRSAADKMDVSEDFVYSSIINRSIQYSRIQKIEENIDYDLRVEDVDRFSLSNGDYFEIPKNFDQDLMWFTGMLFGDGNISKDDNRGLIRISNSNRSVLERCQRIISDKFGKKVDIEEGLDDRPASVRLHSKTIQKLFENIGMDTAPKKDMYLDERLTRHENLKYLVRGYMDADGSVNSRVDEMGGSTISCSSVSVDWIKQLRQILESKYNIHVSHRIRESKNKKEEKKNGEIIESNYNKHVLDIRGRDLDKFMHEIGFYSVLKNSDGEEIIEGRQTQGRRIPVGSILQRSPATSSKYHTNFNRGSDPRESTAKSILSSVEVPSSTSGMVEEHIDSDLIWDEIEDIKTVHTELYDLTTENSSFVANGIITHNTAAAVRDSEFGGEDKWTLKAGALVLADQGLACVDEIDKMSSSDRSSMHEGLEQQTISVSKAGINSTLKSRCTLLAAANPKDGRWNEFDPVPAQINLEPPLVSRFDMIFAPEDERTEERDTKLAGHILDTNLRGQQLESGIEPDEETGEVEPDISPELFRKYVAHSRKNHDPVMTEDAMDYIKEFFVSIRAEGEQEGAIPVTARKIEAIVRISEAAARIQLSGTVDKEHAERARDIVMESLKDVGYDEEAGRFDVDMTETNQSTSQRNRRNMLVKTIEDNEDEGEKGAPRDLVVELMVEEHGFDEDKVEYDLRKMGRESEDIYEPTNGEFATL